MIYSRSLKKSQTVKTVWLFYFMQASENIAAMAAISIKCSVKPDKSYQMR